jgi:HK97 family phage portal protein
MGGIRTFFKNIFGTQELENDLNKILYAYLTNNVVIPLPANTATYVNDGYLGNPFVYPVVRKITNSAIGVNWYVKDTRSGDPVTNHELNKFFYQPNPRQTWWELVEELVAWKLITGNRYLYQIKIESGPNSGKVAELWSLPASLVEIKSSGNLNKIVKGYTFNIAPDKIAIPADLIRHSGYFNPQYDSTGTQLYGLSPLHAALNTLQATNLGYESLKVAYQNGGPPVIITGTDNSAAEFSKEQADLINERFNRKYAGSKNKGKWHVQNTPVDVHEVGMSPVDLNTIAAIKLSLRDICNIYSVPSVLFNDNEFSTYNNMREAGKALWTNAVIPELESLKADLNLTIAQPYGGSVSIEYDLTDIEELRQDQSTQAAGLAQAWWMTPNERLVAMGMQPDNEDPMMNMRFIPMGLVPMAESTIIDEQQLAKANAWYEQHKGSY